MNLQNPPVLNESLTPPPVQKKPKKKSTLVIILSVLGGLFLLCIIISLIIPSPKKEDESKKNTQLPTEKPVATEVLPTSTQKPTATITPTKEPSATPNPNLFQSGIYLVGKEIQPGVYKGMESGCYWERLKDLSGGFDSILANGNSDGQFYVQLKESDFAFSTNCDVLLIDESPNVSGEFPKSIEPGMYRVGVDINSGIYKSAEEGCYWERLKDFYGGFDGIIANGNSYGQFYVGLKEGDVAFSTSCSMDLISDLPKVDEFPMHIEPGMYMIGYDIKPGRYKGATEGCYWERLNDASGGFSAILANGNSDGQFYVQVYDTDFALSTSCALDYDGQ